MCSFLHQMACINPINNSGVVRNVVFEITHLSIHPTLRPSQPLTLTATLSSAVSALLGSSSLCRRGPLVHTLSLFHHLEGEEEEREEGERPGERGHLLVHLGLGRRRWKCPSFLETLLCADLQEEEKVIVSDQGLEPGRDSLREALLGLASFSETVPGAWHFCGW